ncbi:MAG: sigma-70 family RNA polymerase sigma factor [Candidatus Eremiobacteraeota bacterium]|nr:sigma-70 family RNA polymerase sigma factor [Candidatus Eremiobacteraeota bacterium]MBV8497873.1 sigma-70 family RNA polymerase sigma factor [Candidatus Eremiobacteraeota bacterium]
MEPSEHLFRQESGRIVAALSRIFGLDNLALAEDVTQDVFCRALEVWKLRGVPHNPPAWLMKAARNRAIDVLRRERTARNLVPELGRLLNSEWTMVATVNDLFGAETIKDDQLRMMFSCCDRSLSEDAQVALTLRLQCGFTTAEIAGAFLSKNASIEKRIERGKKVLANSKRLFDFGDAELPARLSAVHRTLYLMFNEGYHGASREMPVRAELCNEAMRLAALLLENARVATPATHALCALMYLHAARLPARVDANGNLVPLARQDRALWNRTLIARGNELLDRSASGSELSEYHVEAAIASLHSGAATDDDTDWDRLLWLYDILIRIRPSPVIALNRAIAVAQRDGPESGIAAIGAIPASDQLASYPFLPAALGELELRAGRVERARNHFEAAAALARSPMERRFLELRVEAARGEPQR